MDMMPSQNARAKEWRNGSTEIMSHMIAAAGAGTTDNGPGDTHRHVESQYLVQGDSKGHRNYYIQQESINMTKRLLLPIVIRRTGNSRAPDGKTILDLKPYVESVVWSVQRADEMAAVQQLYDDFINRDDNVLVIFFIAKLIVPSH